VAVSALAFAIFHFSPHALVAATLAGLALGAVRVWSGALLPAIALHLANNGAVLVATRAGIAEPPLRVWTVAAALVALGGGGLLATRRR
jgi:membrane protease YdiL (CAAX protease family)